MILKTVYLVSYSTLKLNLNTDIIPVLCQKVCLLVPIVLASPAPSKSAQSVPSQGQAKQSNESDYSIFLSQAEELEGNMLQS